MFQKIKWFIQRGKRGWADCDVWGFNDYLTEIIVGGLKQLAKEHNACPPELYDDKTEGDECHKWREILEEIICGFEAFKEMDIFFDDEKKYKSPEKKFKKGMKLFVKYFPNLWD